MEYNTMLCYSSLPSHDHQVVQGTTEDFHGQFQSNIVTETAFTLVSLYSPLFRYLNC